MANRITGMYSGLDTEGLIKELVKAKSVKVDKTKKTQTKTTWKQEKWKELNTKLNKLMSNSVANLRWSSSFQKKIATSSNSAVSVITGEGAMNSVQKLSVIELASSGYLTGAEVTTQSGDKATAETKLSELKFGTTSIGEGSFNVTANGKTTEIKVSADSSIQDIVFQLRGAGVSANFDEKNQRVFVGALTSGTDADFTITANDGNGNAALSLLGINTGVSDESKEQYAAVKSMSSLMVYDSEGNFDAASTVANIQNDTTSDAYKKLMEYAKANYKPTLDAAKSAVSTLEADIKKLEAEAENDTLTEGDKAKVAEELETKRAELETKKSDLEAIQANYDGGIYDIEALNKAAETIKTQVEYATTMSESDDTSMVNTTAKRLTGGNAVIELNGVRYTSNTNNVTVNGLTFTCNAVVSDVTITTQDDTSGIYDMIKNFVKEYNAIINELDSLYNAEATKIEPLTDEEKEAVSDSEAEKLEKSVKDALLRRDETLGGVFNGLRETMQLGFEVNGKTMYLADFGIATGNYFSTAEGERNAFHIDGDPDDSVTSGNADVLKSMIATDSETVVNFFTQLGQTLYKKMQDLSASSEYSSFGSFYDDKRMKTDLDEIKNRIAKQEQEITDYEDKYYAKFSAMEVALSKMQSKTDSISQLFSM